MKNLIIKNGKIITPQGIIKNELLYVIDGVISDITTSNHSLENAIEIDAQNNYVSPGFIDIHLHGGGGFDFMDNNLDEYIKIAETHATHGTTAMNPTTLSCEREDLAATLKTYEKAANTITTGAQFIGVHIEGPYFAMSQKGAQDPRYIRNPNPAEYKEIIETTNVVTRWSAAPELPGAIEFGEYLCSKNIIPSIAHTDAIYEDVIKAFNAGYKLATHFYSAMSGVTRRNAFRYAGVVEAGYLLDDMYVEAIADGIHLPAPLLKLIYKIKGPDRICLVTDAMRAAGTNVTESILGSRQLGLPVLIEDDVAKLPDRTAFAGSIATTDRLVRNMVQLAEVPLTDAIKMMTETPAIVMKVADKKGTLQKGKDADIVIFNDNIKIKTTIVNGNIVYNA